VAASSKAFVFAHGSSNEPDWSTLEATIGATHKTADKATHGSTLNTAHSSALSLA